MKRTAIIIMIMLLAVMSGTAILSCRETAKADTNDVSYTFESTPINYLGLTTYNVNSTAQYYAFFMASFNFRYYTSNGEGKTVFSQSTTTRIIGNSSFDGYSRFTDSNPISNYGLKYVNFTNMTKSDNVEAYPINGVGFFEFGTFVQSGNWRLDMPVMVIEQIDYIDEIDYIEIGTTGGGYKDDLTPSNQAITIPIYPDFYYTGFANNSQNFFYIEYYYNYNHPILGMIKQGIIFNIPCPNDWTYIPRTYTINQNATEWQDGYDIGYGDGYNDGNSAGWTDGYAEGEEYGEQVGEARGIGIGYQQGIEDANQYTFSSLITAAIDIPIRTFQAFFNYDVLGFNLSYFIQSLFTVIVVITVIGAVL